MLKRLIKRVIIGFVIGMIAGNAIALFISLMSSGGFRMVTDILIERTGGEVTAIFVQTLMSGLYGALAFAGISVYEIERLPLALSSGLHCLLIVLLHVPNALFLGWENSLTEVMITAAIQVAGYFVVWLIINGIYRSHVRMLNDLQKKHQVQEEGASLDSDETKK